MNTSSEAAEQVIRISLQGIEVAARLSGSGAKNIAALLVAIAKDKQKVRGKTTLTNMLKSGRPLKVFSINICKSSVFIANNFSVISNLSILVRDVFFLSFC